METRIVHVGDRTADMCDFFHACRATQSHFLVRAAGEPANTRGGWAADSSARVRCARGRRHDVHPLDVPASHGRAARSTQVQLAGSLGFRCYRSAPKRERAREPLEVWAIRVWEEHPPQGEEPLERILLTSLPTTTLAQAWERVGWSSFVT